MAATKSLYSEEGADVAPPLTDAPCSSAPAAGVHLYHFPLSLCSQKVRQGLEEKQVRWQSHIVLLSAYEQYDPSYLRINPRAVVPTLVRDGRVTTDSANILRYIDRAFDDGPGLVPPGAEEAGCMERFVEAADAIFVEALTYGDIPGVDKPLPLRLYTRDKHANKVELLARLAREHAHDPELKTAYERKLAIVESTRRTFLSPDSRTEVLRATDADIAALERQLDDGPFAAGGWLSSASFSLADIEWAVVLNRLRLIGLADSRARQKRGGSPTGRCRDGRLVSGRTRHRHRSRGHAAP